jgi:hypothetical protein
MQTCVSARRMRHDGRRLNIGAHRRLSAANSGCEATAQDCAISAQRRSSFIVHRSSFLSWHTYCSIDGHGKQISSYVEHSQQLQIP